MGGVEVNPLKDWSGVNSLRRWRGGQSFQRVDCKLFLSEGYVEVHLPSKKLGGQTSQGVEWRSILPVGSVEVNPLVGRVEWRSILQCLKGKSR